MDNIVINRYYIGGDSLAFHLAHSSHEIAKDPEEYQGTYHNIPRRLLHRVGSHPIRDAFEHGLRDKCIELCEASGINWKSVGMYRQGVAEGDENPPTILITVHPHPGRSVFIAAAKLVSEIEATLRERHFDDVHVEVITYASPYASDTYDATSGMEFLDDIWAAYTTVLPRHSIGPKETTGTGSMSGYIRICRTKGCDASLEASNELQPKSSSKTAVLGLTCHHVAAFGRPDRLLPLTWDDRVQMTWPAERDHELYMNHLKWRLDFWEEQEAIEKSAREPRGVSDVPSGESTDESSRSATKFRNMMTRVNHQWETDHVMGTVLASSGIIPRDKKGSMDWAIVQLNRHVCREHRGHENHSDERYYATKCIKKMNIKKPDFLKDITGFFSPTVEKEIVPKTVIERMSRVSDDEDPVYVYTRGRTTPFGVGILHDVRDAVKIEYTTNSEGESIITVSTELVVLNVRNKASACPAFSAAGDSGSPVRLADGRVIGFVFSSEEDAIPRPTTYVAFAETVLEDIRDAIGAEKVSFIGHGELARDAE